MTHRIIKSPCGLITVMGMPIDAGCTNAISMAVNRLDQGAPDPLAAGLRNGEKVFKVKIPALGPGRPMPHHMNDPQKVLALKRSERIYRLVVGMKALPGHIGDAGSQTGLIKGKIPLP